MTDARIARHAERPPHHRTLVPTDTVHVERSLVRFVLWALAGMSHSWCAWQWVYVVALRVLMTWVYNNAGRSLFAMDLLHPGLFVWWYLWPVSGAGLSMPAVYDPRSLALIAMVLAAMVTYLWGPRTLARYRYAA